MATSGYFFMATDTVVTELLVGLPERGLDVSRPMLVGVDGAKALRKAVTHVLERPVIQRCQIHKVGNWQVQRPPPLRAALEAEFIDLSQRSCKMTT